MQFGPQQTRAYTIKCRFAGTAEHITNGGEQLCETIQEIIQKIFDHDCIPVILKVRLLAPEFKNKGTNKDSRNYRI